MPNDSRQTNVKRLVSELIEGQISSDEFQQLQRIVIDDEASRNLYLDMMEIDVELHRIFVQIDEESEIKVLVGEEDESAETKQPSDLDSSDGRSPVLGFLGGVVNFASRPAVAAALVAVMAIPLGLAMLGVLPMPFGLFGDMAAGPNGVESEQTFAQITGISRDCFWQERASNWQLSSRLKAGEVLKLDSGLVRVEFANGAVVLVEGPARFSVDGANAGSLDLGKLTAQVPEQAIGFVVNTPVGRVVDLGTEFGVDVAKSGEAEVYVFDGIVRLEPGKDLPHKQVAGGEAMRVSTDTGKTDSIAYRDEAFIRRLPEYAAVTKVPASLADARLIDTDGDGKGDEVNSLALPLVGSGGELRRGRSVSQPVTGVGEHNRAEPDLPQRRYRFLFVLPEKERVQVLAAEKIELGLTLFSKSNPRGLRIDVHGLIDPQSSASESEYEAPSELLVEGAFDDQSPVETRKFFDVTDFVKTQVAAGKDLIVFRLQAGPETLPNRDGLANCFVFSTAHAFPDMGPPALKIEVSAPLRIEGEGSRE